MVASNYIHLLTGGTTRKATRGVMVRLLLSRGRERGELNVYGAKCGRRREFSMREPSWGIFSACRFGSKYFSEKQR